MARGKTIYIELVHEGTYCWRPVNAEELDEELYRITGETPTEEDWAFVQGDIVKCRIRKCRIRAFQEGGLPLLAYEKARQGPGGAGK
jgi:hypothetical protein